MFSSDTSQRTEELLYAVVQKTLSAWPETLPTDSGERSLRLATLLAQQLGIVDESERPMAIVTKTIGTTGRDYSTITAWEADLDNGAVYSAGDDAVGEIYNDSAFAEAAVVNGGGTIGLNSRKLTVPESERHDGTAGTGARMEMSSGGQRIELSVDTMLEWWEHDGNSVATGQHGIVTVSTNSTIKNCLAHHHDDDGSRNGIQLSSSTPSGVNCISYANSGVGIGRSVGAATTYIRNCTSHTNSTYGFGDNDNAGNFLQNCIATDNGTADFQQSAPANATYDHNIASDTSASGTGSSDSVAAADLFVSTVGGSEDLHLKSGAVAIDAGTDFGTTPTGVNIDIDGRDRDAEGDMWDIGADEFVADTPAGSAFPFIRYYGGIGYL